MIKTKSFLWQEEKEGNCRSIMSISMTLRSMLRGENQLLSPTVHHPPFDTFHPTISDLLLPLNSKFTIGTNLSIHHNSPDCPAKIIVPVKATPDINSHCHYLEYASLVSKTWLPLPPTFSLHHFHHNLSNIHSSST